MKGLLLAAMAAVLLSGCDLTVEAPPPADTPPLTVKSTAAVKSTPAGKNPAASKAAPGATTGIAPGGPKASPPPGDWKWKDYKPPLAQPAN